MVKMVTIDGCKYLLAKEAANFDGKMKTWKLIRAD